MPTSWHCGGLPGKDLNEDIGRDGNHEVKEGSQNVGNEEEEPAIAVKIVKRTSGAPDYMQTVIIPDSDVCISEVLKIAAFSCNTVEGLCWRGYVPCSIAR